MAQKSQVRSIRIRTVGGTLFALIAVAVLPGCGSGGASKPGTGSNKNAASVVAVDARDGKQRWAVGVASSGAVIVGTGSGLVFIVIGGDCGQGTATFMALDSNTG